MLALDRLGELADEMVFLGGCATGLLITDPAAPPIRVTRDVDAIVKVLSLNDYYKLSAKLRAHGFSEDMSEGAPLCRWLADKVILDVMPTDTRILGFGNEWYQAAADHAEVISLPTGKQFRMVSAPYFLITKLEAFEGRGGGDYLASHDMEDIIAVLDGRLEIVDEVKHSDPALVKEISERFRGLMQEKYFIDSVSGHMPTDATSQARIAVILSRIHAMTL